MPIKPAVMHRRAMRRAGMSAVVYWQATSAVAAASQGEVA